MKKTKLLTSLCALALVLSLGACSGAECDETGGVSGNTDDVGQEKAYKITLDCSEYAVVFDLPTSADAGDEVSFSVLTQSGFAISEVSVTYRGLVLVEVEKEDEELEDGEESEFDEEQSESSDEPEYEEVEGDIPVDVSGDAITGYSFVMPDKDVTVKVEALGAYFNLGYDPNYLVLTDYTNDAMTMSSFFTGVYEPETGDLLGNGTSNFIQAGKDVLIVGKRQSSGTNVKYYANGVELEEVTDSEINAGYYAFAYTMIAGDVQITASAENLYIHMKVAEDDRVKNVRLYTLDSDNSQVEVTEDRDLEIYNDIVYITAEFNEEYADDYELYKVLITYDEYTSSSSAEVRTISNNAEWSSTSTGYTNGNIGYVDANTRRYRIPVEYYTDGELTVSFDYYNLHEYEGQPFVGTWYGAELYGASNTTSKNSYITFQGSGKIACSSSVGISSSTVASVDEDGNPVLSSGRTFYNNGIVGVMFYDNSSGSWSANDLWVMAKYDGEDTPDVTFERWIDSSRSSTSHRALVINVYLNGEYVGSIYGDNDLDTKLYAGVTIEYLNGTESITDTNPEFIVKDANGNTIREVVNED